VEVVELLGLDDSSHESESLEMLSGSESHGVNVELGEFVVDVLAGVLSVVLAGLGVG